MSVIWKYLNKRSGAIDAIRDYDSMKFIIENTSEDIKQAYAAMTSLHPSGLMGCRTPATHMQQKIISSPDWQTSTF